MSTTDLPPAYDAIKELGVYDTLPSDVKSLLPQLVDLPKDVQEKAQAAMAQEAAKDSTVKGLMAEVVALGDSALVIDQAFERVRIALGKVDQNNYKDKKGKPIPKLQPTWVGYQKRWTTFLWDSRDVATATEAYVRDFVDIIIPSIEAEQLDDAKIDLLEFINRKDPFGEKLNATETHDYAQKFSQDLIDLQKDLKAFKDTFDEFAKDQEVDLGDAINTKKSEIEAIQLEIKKCETVVMAMGIALGVTLAATGAGALAAVAALGPVGPFVAIGIVITGAIAAISELGTLIAYVVEANERRNGLATAQRQLASLESQLKHLQELQALLQNQKADIDLIATRIDRFKAIWGAVAHDAHLIYIKLETAATVGGSNSAFRSRLNLAKNMYTALADALALYATNLGKFEPNA
ncbi:hypothetical protein CVT24_008505 [Panaeolus cyanescens]|uniref:Uncharacterized protein n=1 Tax=Panaeolus cyanescens TaxID=181874 RepID=A0A409W4I9_9AGAR|nr:hypothetical protein CVT24_008505 [Panaeolus cyanescens]